MKFKSELPVVLVILAILLCGGMTLYHYLEKNAEEACAAVGATPHYTSKEAQYLCVTPDGRIVG